MGMIMTSAGLALVARLQAENKTAKINRMIYAFKSGISSGTTPSVSEIIPADVRYNDNSISGKFVDASNVVYTSKLDTSVGDFSFNWLGLFCAEYNTLMAICHTDLQYKKRSEGFNTGNYMTKNLGFGFANVMETLQVIIEAGSSDVNFNEWLKSADERLRISNFRLFGNGLEQAMASTILSAGYVYPFTAWCGGLRVENKSTQAIGFTGVTGDVVWLEAWIDNSVRDSVVKWRLVKTIASQNLVDVFDGTAWHFFLKLAVYSSASNFSNVFVSVGQYKLMREAIDAEISSGAGGAVLTPAGLLKRVATTVKTGVVRLATESEAMNFIDNVALTPAKLQAIKADYNKYGVTKLATENEVKTGAKNVAVTPEMLHKVVPTGATPGLVKFASGQDVIDNVPNVAITPESMRALTATTERAGLCKIATAAETISGDATAIVTARILTNFWRRGVCLYNGLASNLRGERFSGTTGTYGMTVFIPSWVDRIVVLWCESSTTNTFATSIYNIRVGSVSIEKMLYGTSNVFAYISKTEIIGQKELPHAGDVAAGSMWFNGGANWANDLVRVVGYY